MNDVIFKSNEKNPLTELSQLRLEVESDQQEFSLKCFLIFGNMSFEYKDRVYEVGITRAHLRLALEGCKTALGSLYGESVLEHVDEEDGLTTQSSVGIDASGAADVDAGATANTKAHAQAARSRKKQRSQVKRHLPVAARPGDSWAIKAQSVTGKSVSTMEGTAIPSQRLCILQRKQGGNRISITGEVHVSKSAVKVFATGGNVVGKKFNEFLNKDAIVSLILKRAIQRETSTYLGSRTASTVAVSQCEVWEE